MAFEKNEPGIWTPKEDGDSIEGKLLKIQPNVGANKSMMYSLQVDDKPMNVWGSTLLDANMIGIEEGDLIRITYKGLGEKSAGKNAPKKFDVEVDRTTTTSDEPSIPEEQNPSM